MISPLLGHYNDSSAEDDDESSEGRPDDDDEESCHRCAQCYSWQNVPWLASQAVRRCWHVDERLLDGESSPRRVWRPTWQLKVTNRSRWGGAMRLRTLPVRFGDYCQRLHHVRKLFRQREVKRLRYISFYHLKVLNSNWPLLLIIYMLTILLCWISCLSWHLLCLYEIVFLSL